MSTIIDDNTTDMAMEETLISPRFYTTNYKELDKIDVSFTVEKVSVWNIDGKKHQIIDEFILK